ncbi:MAG: hypothetical protein NZ765_04490 [Anaerolineae bacterium]|nr:hypothetical protein [Anaerolineae bacterium]MDW8070832.1 hypothetical protein [Anaerolineae bacterium]
MKTMFRGRWPRQRWLLVVLPVLLISAIAGTPYAYSASPVTPAVAQQSQNIPMPDLPTAEAPEVQLAVRSGPLSARSGTTASTPSQQGSAFQAQSYNLITNGSFEDGFVEGVAVGWQPFATAGVRAGWHDDTWRPVLYDGDHAQLLALRDAQERDRYVGIFQTVPVVPNADYILTLHGLVRSDEGSVAASNYGYRLQYGIDYAGGNDWRSREIEWVELPWDEQPRTTPPPGGYRIETYTTTIRAQTPRLTLFIRGWKKWVGAAEGNYNIDGISLIMAQVAAPTTGTSTPESAPPASSPAMPQAGAPIAEGDRFRLANLALIILLATGVLWRSRQRHG